MSPESFYFPTVLYGVIGWPLRQSLSPLIHNVGFRQVAGDGAYFRWEIAPEDLAAFVRGFRLLRMGGCSVTIPHKVAIMPLLDGCTEQARAVGAVNTLFWRDGQLWGENTDVTGFMAPLLERELARDMPVLLLGAGGAARAAAAGLHAAGFRNLSVCTPSDRSHLPLAREFGMRAVPWAERHDEAAALVINATPLGMRGKAEEATPYDFFAAPRPQGGALAYDIVYNPLRTRFLREAEQAGRQTISGLEMFFRQADAQFRLWTGQGLPQASRTALEQALGA